MFIWFLCVLSLLFRCPWQPGYVMSGVISLFLPTDYSFINPWCNLFLSYTPPASQPRAQIESAPLIPFMCTHVFPSVPLPFLSLWLVGVFFYSDQWIYRIWLLLVWYPHIFTTKRRMLKPLWLHLYESCFTFMLLNDVQRKTMNGIYSPSASWLCLTLLACLLAPIECFLPFLKITHYLSKIEMQLTIGLLFSYFLFMIIFFAFVPKTKFLRSVKMTSYLN